MTCNSVGSLSYSTYTIRMVNTSSYKIHWDMIYHIWHPVYVPGHNTIMVVPCI